MVKKARDAHTKALQILAGLQKSFLKRLADYILENEGSLKQAADGAEGYGFTLHQLDELFLSRLNLVERTIAELHKTPVQGGNRYRSMVFHASRDEAEQEINSRLEKVPSARVLGITVSPASASSRVTYQFTEIASPVGQQESVAKLVRSVMEDEVPAVGVQAEETDDGPEDLVVDLPEAPPDGVEDDPEDRDNELLVTVLYYGPPLAADG